MSYGVDYMPVAVHHRLYLHKHAGASAIGIVIHVIVGILCVISYIKSLNTHESGLNGSAADTLADNIVYQLRKQCHNIIILHKSRRPGIR